MADPLRSLPTRLVVIVFCALSVPSGSASRLWGEHTRPDEWTAETVALARRLDRRFEDGELETANEIAELPPEVATRFLGSLIGLYGRPSYKKNMPEYLAAAAAAMRKVDGHLAFFERRIEKLTMQVQTGTTRMRLIDIVEAIGTEEAVDLLAKLSLDDRQAESAEYLREFEARLGPEDDSYPDIGINSAFAIWALARLKLPDAPTDTYWRRIRMEDRNAWREWAKARLENKKQAVGASTNRPSLAENGADRESPDPRHLRTFLLVALVLLLIAISVGMAMGGRKIRCKKR